MTTDPNPLPTQAQLLAIARKHLVGTPPPGTVCGCVSCMLKQSDGTIGDSRRRIDEANYQVAEAFREIIQGIPLRALATKTDLSAPFISDLQRSNRVPTSVTLLKILTAALEIIAPETTPADFAEAAERPGAPASPR